jgi:hypothetical protein
MQHVISRYTGCLREVNGFKASNAKFYFHRLANPWLATVISNVACGSFGGVSASQVGFHHRFGRLYPEQRTNRQGGESVTRDSDRK